MIGIQWSGAAVSDLVEIRRYVAEHSPRAAARLARTLLGSVQRLVDHPAAGRPGRVAGTRELIVDGIPFLIAYRVRDGIVEVLRVLHGARKWPSRLR